MPSSPRDLSARELWEQSLRRSVDRRQRRARGRNRADSVIRPTAIESSLPRDLAIAELWEDSISRSLRRRRAAEMRFNTRPTAARRISVVAAAAAIAAPASSLAAGKAGGGGVGSAVSPSSAASTSPLLTDGDQGPEVSVVQRAMGIAPDGVYGPRTAAAVRAFQGSHGLVVDNIVGPYTRGALGLSSQVSGSASDSVGSIQRALGVSDDGVYGPQTRHAVVSFQKRHGLAMDGAVGPATSAALGIGSLPGVIREPVSSTPAASEAPASVQSADVQSSSSEQSARSTRVAATSESASSTQSEPITRTAPSHESAPVRTTPVYHSEPSAQSAPSGSGSGGVRRMITAANQIATKPYVYGGGHGSWKSSGYDCSGSVSYVLHAGGLLKQSQDSSGLMHYGSSGTGRHVTIYANPQHAYMVINGRRFDTSGQRISGSRWTKIQRSSGGFVVRHPAGY